MILPGTVQSGAPGLRGFDTDTVLNSQLAQEFYDQEYKFCLRYLSLGCETICDLTAAEASNILNSGLALMAVQHVMDAGWSPTGNLGAQNGQWAARNANSVGFPPGVNVWCDLEGIAAGTAAQNVIDYCNAWYNAVKAGGFVPGLYVGANAILSGQQLYDLDFQHYWQSMSQVPSIPNRGYQLIQNSTTTVNGIGIDVDVTQTDNEGGQVLWLVQGS
jgi:hypothetical protein